MAGVQVLALMNEPTAAAMAYSMKTAHQDTMMVVDWGGGTVDVTILRNVDGVFMEQASKGIQQLGGLDFDTALSKLVLDTVTDQSSWSAGARAGFRLDVERAKIQLSTAEEVSVPLPGGQYRQISRSMYEQAIKAQIERVREPIEQCLTDLGAKKSDIDALVLVGGTCKMPAIRTFVSELMGQGPATGVDPMTAVAEGAAVAAAILTGELDDRDFFVSTEHALGTIAISDSMDLEFSELIPRNHKLPARVTNTYVPAVPFQEQLNLQVIEGDPTKPLEDDDNVILKNWELVLPDPQPLGEITIELTYSYDVDGILHVAASDSLGNELLNDVVSYGATVDKRNLAKIAQRAATALDGGRLQGSDVTHEMALSPELRKLVTDVQTKIIPFIHDTEAAPLRDSIKRVEHGDASAAEELRAATRKYSYLL